MNLMIISHALSLEKNRRRWEAMAKIYDVKIHIIIPRIWGSNWFKENITWVNKNYINGNYQVITYNSSSSHDWSKYFLISVDLGMVSIKPDMIFVMQEEHTLILQQAIFYKKIYAPNAKIGFFSYNNLAVSLNSRLRKIMWNRVCEQTDFAIAGSQEINYVLKTSGYDKPIFIQTELGVDEKGKSMSTEQKRVQKKKLGLSGFVIGFIGRITESKGILDLVEALSMIQSSFTFLCVGDGDLLNYVKEKTSRKNIKCAFTGYVNSEDVFRYLNVMNCLVLPSRTTSTWKEQFGLVLAEAMSLRIPVIGSNSGAIPEVIENAGLIFEEGCIDQLINHLLILINCPDYCKKLGNDGYYRYKKEYDVYALCKKTKLLIEQVIGREVKKRKEHVYEGEKF